MADFTPHKNGKFGRFSYCRPCNAAYVRRQNADPEVRARNAARQRARRADPDGPCNYRKHDKDLLQFLAIGGRA